MLTPHVLVLLALGALTIRVLCLLALHLLPTGLNPLHNALSLYAASRYGILYHVEAIAGGVCALSLAGALVLLRAPLPGFGLVALSAYGLTRLLIVTVPAHADDKDASKDAPLTRRVAVHLVLAIVGYTAIALATGVLTAPIEAWSAWHGSALLLTIAGILTPASVVLTVITTISLAQWRSYLGLLQRVIALGIVCWLGVVLIPLMR